MKNISFKETELVLVEVNDKDPDTNHLIDSLLQYLKKEGIHGNKIASINTQYAAYLSPSDAALVRAWFDAQ